MTVKHLENLQRQQAAMSQAADPSVVNKFKAGFTECANEVGRFPGLDPMMKRRLLQHLSNCINGVKTEIQIAPQNTPIQPQPVASQQPQVQSTVQVHILPSPPSSPEQQDSQQQHHHHQQTQQQSLFQITPTSNGYFLTNGNGTGIQLVPTKMPNGSIALVLPQSIPAAPLPMLIPIPTRTSSTASAASSTSSYTNERLSRESMTSPNNSCYAPPSPPNSTSYESMDCHSTHNNSNSTTTTTSSSSYLQHSNGHHQTTGVKRSHSPGPLSLVMHNKKPYQMQTDEAGHWRPW